jgi:ABC-type Fe3+/spermidine/putrescine transport system ATPase subunit
MQMGKLEIDRVRVSFGAVTAVDDVSLRVAEGETVVLLGSSGCGKTTLLRTIAGFIRPDAGDIRIAGRTIVSDTLMVPPEKRLLSMVFQSYAVWPHKTVGENLAYGLKLRGLDREAIRTRIGGALAMVRMEAYAERYPAELSGGQQQRVALARALVLEPQILLFDEPLSNLDATLREHMRFEIKALINKLGITSIYVTHDQNEAMVVGDRIAVMSKGRIEQVGTPEQIYNESETDFVATFIGLANVFEGEVVDRDTDGMLRVRTQGLGEITARSPVGQPARGAVRIYLRPENVRIGEAPGANVLRGHLQRRSFLGAQTDLVIAVNGVPIRAIGPTDTLPAQLDEGRCVSFDPAKCLVLASHA